MVNPLKEDKLSREWSKMLNPKYGFIRENWREFLFIFLIVAAALYFQGLKGLGDLFDGFLLFLYTALLSAMIFKWDILAIIIVFVAGILFAYIFKNR